MSARLRSRLGNRRGCGVDGVAAAPRARRAVRAADEERVVAGVGLTRSCVSSDAHELRGGALGAECVVEVDDERETTTLNTTDAATAMPP
jgi:hypothetical protein